MSGITRREAYLDQFWRRMNEHVCIMVVVSTSFIFLFNIPQCSFLLHPTAICLFSVHFFCHSSRIIPLVLLNNNVQLHKDCNGSARTQTQTNEWFEHLVSATPSAGCVNCYWWRFKMQFFSSAFCSCFSPRTIGGYSEMGRIKDGRPQSSFNKQIHRDKVTWINELVHERGRRDLHSPTFHRGICRPHSICRSSDGKRLLSARRPFSRAARWRTASSCGKISRLRRRDFRPFTPKSIPQTLSSLTPLPSYGVRISIPGIRNEIVADRLAVCDDIRSNKRVCCVIRSCLYSQCHSVEREEIKRTWGAHRSQRQFVLWPQFVKKKEPQQSV